MKAGLFGVLTFIAVMGAAGAVDFCPPRGCPPEPALMPAAAPGPVSSGGACLPVQPVAQRTRMVPEERVVQVPERRWVTERRTVPCTKTVYVNEPYTVNETRWERRPERRTRQVTRTVRDVERRTVTETVYQTVCDPVTGRTLRCPREVTRTISVPVERKVCVREPYTVNVRHRVTVPVTKYRRVARTVPSTREIVERRCVTKMVPKTVTVMRPVVENCPPLNCVPAAFRG